jgi:hypothetical protein
MNNAHNLYVFIKLIELVLRNYILGLGRYYEIFEC